MGQLGLTVTNFGVLGNGWNRIDGKILPSCQYKQHTDILQEQVEHFSYAGLWVGGVVNNERRVSTAIVDGVFESGQEGFEFFATSEITIKSSLVSDDFYDPSAVSHQDFILNFRDYGTTTNDNRGFENHKPLGIEVTLKSYAWNYSYADAFVILDYTIKNMSPNTIDDLYAGIWTDPSVANMNYTSRYEPGGGFTWYDNLNGFDESADPSQFARDIGYQYDEDGDDGWAESYIGVTWLGGSVKRPFVDTYYNQWAWTSSTNSQYPGYNMALTDAERYTQLSSSVEKNSGSPVTADGYPADPTSWLFLVSAGPFGSVPRDADSLRWSLPPGDSCQVVMAVIAARWNGVGADSYDRRELLHINSDWAQKAFDGEDKNRNNILDPEEDLNGNGILDRYVLPAPPPPPEVALDVGDQQVTIYWRDNAEDFIDPISREQDFEGYRIYGSRKTRNGITAEFTLMGEFDKDDPDSRDIGYNTGFDTIRIVNEAGEPDSIEINGEFYHYQFVNTGVKNGWQNYYTVTAFDRGDPKANLASLESSRYAKQSHNYVFPGVKPVEDDNMIPSVYPNPYRGQALWDGYGSRDRMVWFQNLPRRAEIRIFTLAGDLVDIIRHDEFYSGGDVKRINSSPYPDDPNRHPIFSGGEHAWDLITRHDQAISSGLYLFTVENTDSESEYFGTVQEGKFLILK